MQGAARHIEIGVVELTVPSVGLTGELIEPDEPDAIVLMAHGERARRVEARNRQAAETLAKANLAVLAFDLLRDAEADDPTKPFDIDLLTDRFLDAIRWVKRQPDLSRLPMGLFAIHTGAAAAIRAAGIERETVGAVVCRGGRPDLASQQGCDCRTAVLYVVGGQDERLLALNAVALPRFGAVRRLEIIEGASHLFEEPGTLEAVTFLAESWFLEHLVSPRNPPAGLN